jgi:hypothetical protein
MWTGRSRRRLSYARSQAADLTALANERSADVAVHIGEMTTDVVGRGAPTGSTPGQAAARGGAPAATDPWGARDEVLALLHDVERRRFRLSAVDHDD